jgi:uncharacterized protein YdeI (YjbR/CyaY-like superfamily)
MPPKGIQTLDARTRGDWRAWLRKHHGSASEIWLVFHKSHTGVRGVTYDEAVEEAICYGWIDSVIRRLDDSRYARKFTPRKPGSRWSTANRRRYDDLARRGLLAAAGRKRPPTDRDGDAPRPDVADLPPYIERGLRAHPRAWAFFRSLPPSARRLYVGWIDSAKRDETKARRLCEAIDRLSAGRRLGMK